MLVKSALGRVKHCAIGCCFFWLLAGQAMAAPLVITDDLGREIKLSAPARRVVVLGDFAAELVVALKAQNLLVGRARWVSWPPEVGALPHLGLQTQPNLEVLLSWQPDLILADAHLRQALPLLDKLNLPVAIYQGRDMPAIKHAISSLALALARQEQGAKLMAFVNEVETILAARRLEPQPLLLAFSQHGPPYFDILSVRPLLALAGLINVIPDKGSVNPEWLLYHPPAMAVLVLWRPAALNLDLAKSWQELGQRPELATIESLYLMDSRLAYNLQALAGLLYLAKWRHPETMGDIDPLKYHQRLWQEFFGMPLLSPMVYPYD